MQGQGPTVSDMAISDQLFERHIVLHLICLSVAEGGFERLGLDLQILTSQSGCWEPVASHPRNLLWSCTGTLLTLAAYHLTKSGQYAQTCSTSVSSETVHDS